MKSDNTAGYLLRCTRFPKAWQRAGSASGFPEYVSTNHIQISGSWTHLNQFIYASTVCKASLLQSSGTPLAGSDGAGEGRGVPPHQESGHCCSLVSSHLSVPLEPLVVSHLVFLAICSKGTWRSQVALVAVTVIYPISFKTKRRRDLRARITSVMVTCRHSLWVAFTCRQGDDTTLIHHPTPTWSPQLSQRDLLKGLWVDFKWILKHHTSRADPLVSHCKTIQDCLSAVTWQRWWGEQNDQMFPGSWDGKPSERMLFQGYWQSTRAIRHAKHYQELKALQLWLLVLCLTSIFH